jgi:hypothetical protein
MLPRMLHLHPSTYQRLIRLSKEAEKDGAYRVAKRLRAVILNSQGHTSGELAKSCKRRAQGSPSGCSSIRPRAWTVCWKDFDRDGHRS